MKAILISTRPQWVEKIINGIKKDEIRKGTAIGKAINKLIEEQGVAPMLIYCTKGNKNECLIPDLQPDKVYHPLTEKLHRGVYSIVEEKAIWNDCKKYILNGKVVARFNATVDFLELKMIEGGLFFAKPDKEVIELDLNENAQIDNFELLKYTGYKLGTLISDIHITKLEIFDKPKEISEFMKTLDNFDGIDCWRCSKRHNCSFNRDKKCEKLKLTRAPQSWCYVEVENENS